MPGCKINEQQRLRIFHRKRGVTILGKLTSLIFMFLSCKFMCCQAPGLEEATVHTQGKSVAFCIALILFQGAIDGILSMVFRNPAETHQLIW